MSKTIMPEIDEKIWDSFILSRSGSFLQSWIWGKFQETSGKKILFLKENDWQALAVIHPLKFNKTYFYIPHGPVLDSSKRTECEIFTDILNKIKSLAKDQGAIFLKIELKTSDQKIADTLSRLGFENSPITVQPQDTSVVNINKSEDEILKSFEKRCRNEISLAARKNVSFALDNSANGINNFLTLLGKTSNRDSFKTHPLPYYKNLIETLSPSGNADLFFAKLGSETISACLIVYFGSTASYIHAASCGAYRAANALVWYAMKESKKKGCKEFDLYGVAPLNSGETHSWYGLTKFKESFSGKRTKYIGAYDYSFSDTWHSIYKLYRFKKL